MSIRVEVRVIVEYDLDGQVQPMQIQWPDGRSFYVDRVLDVRMAPAKSGGSGIRYLCRIQGREVPLYYGFSPIGKGRVW